MARLLPAERREVRIKVLLVLVEAVVDGARNVVRALLSGAGGAVGRSRKGWLACGRTSPWRTKYTVLVDVSGSSVSAAMAHRVSERALRLRQWASGGIDAANKKKSKTRVVTQRRDVSAAVLSV